MDTLFNLFLTGVLISKIALLFRDDLSGLIGLKSFLYFFSELLTGD